MNRTLFALGLAALLTVLVLLVGPSSGPARADPEPASAAASSSTAETPILSFDSGGGVRMEARLSHPLVTTGATEAFLAVTIAAGDEAPERLPLQLALVLDRSASMAGARLRHARKAARRLVQELSEQDHLAIVHYGSEAITLPALRADASGKAQMLAFIDALEAEGGTNLGEGLRHAGAALAPLQGDAAIRRLVLLSDGHPTVGDVEPQALADLAGALRAQGIGLSTVGLGEDFNEDLLARIADLGEGSYDFLPEEIRLTDRISRHLREAEHAVAESLTLSLNPGPNVELLEVLGHPATAGGGPQTLRLPGLSSGQSRRVIARLRIHADGTHEALDVAALQLRVTRAGTRATQLARVDVSAHHTGDAMSARARRDAAASLPVARALSAANAARVAQALEERRPTDAHARLADTRRLLGALADGTGVLKAPDAQALQQLRAELEQQEAWVRDELASPAMGFGSSPAVKSLKLAARRGLVVEGGAP